MDLIKHYSDILSKGLNGFLANTNNTKVNSIGQSRPNIPQAPTLGRVNQIPQIAMNAFNANQQLAPWSSQNLPVIPKINLPQFNIQQPVANFAVNQVVRPIAESVLNTPRNLALGSNMINQGLAKGQIKPVLQGAGYAGEGVLNLGTFGSAGVAKSLIKPTIKMAVKEGAKTGGLIGAGYGLAGGLQSGDYNIGNLIKEIGGGAVGGAVLGAGGGAIGGIIGKLTTRTPQVEAQLRDLQGRWVAGDKPIRPKSVPQNVWDFQVKFNQKYGRNPYTPVYHDDLNAAIKYEIDKRGAGLSIRDVNKDKNPLGTPNVANAGNKAEANLPYLAGLVDGEGHIRLTPAKNGAGRAYHRPEIIVTQKDRGILDELQSLYGGRVDKQVKANWNNTGTREIHTWRLSGSKAVELAKKIEPMLRIKAEQVKRISGLQYDQSGRMIKSTIPDLSVIQPSRLQKSAGLYDTAYHAGSTARTEFKGTEGVMGQGVYLHDNPNTAREAAAMERDGNIADIVNHKVQITTNKIYQFGHGYPDEAQIAQIKKQGFDGIKTADGETVIFDPKNIKVISNDRVAQPTIGDIHPVTQAVDEGQRILEEAKASVRNKMVTVKPYTQIKMEAKAKGPGPLPWETSNRGGTIPSEAKFQLPLKEPQSRTGGLPDGKLPKAPSGSAPPQQQIEQTFADIINRKGTNVKEKVGALDYLRTPDRVLQKMGLGEQMGQLRTAYETYQKELPVEIGKITQWANKVSPESNQRIFQYLDGKAIKLTGEELKVAGEIKTYLKVWADRLGLPADSRITNYITHIFDRDLIQKEFDPEFAALMRDKVAGSVYDPFVEQRLGKAGYVEDTWRALDAYVKRATRKVNLDPVLERISQNANSLEDSQFDYVKAFIDRVNMRPTKIDNLVDNTIKQIIGYKLGQRPTTVIASAIRKMIYRGTLGLNPASALKNLSQGANTYAKLGEKYTVVGYTNFIKSLLNGSKELEESGILGQDVVQDRTLSATKKFWEKTDKVLFSFFEGAEKINRGAAYFGAKAKAINEGKSEAQAIEFAKKIVRDTQFQFSSIDTPRVLSSDIGKVLGQFQSYGLKQGEFLGEMVKSKDVTGLARYSAATLVFILTIGKALGMKPQDIIPSIRIGGSPLFTLGGDLVATATNQKDQYGNQPTGLQRVQKIGNDLVPFIPAGVQIKKTLGGIGDVSRGYAQTNSGNVKYPVSQDTGNFIRGAVLGPSNLPEAQKYRGGDINPLSENQSDIFKQSTDKQGVYDTFMQARKQSSEEDKIKGQLKTGGSTSVENKIYYNDNGTVRSIDLNPPTKGTGIDAYTNQNWNVSTALKVFKADIPQAQKDVAYQKLGVDKSGLEYAYKAGHSSDVKTQYITAKAGTESHAMLIQDLINGRVKSVAGTLFANDQVITNLNQAGIISDAEAKYLKSVKYERSGSNVGTSAKSKKLKKLKPIKISLPKVKKIKQFSVKPKKLKKYSLKKVKTLA